MGKRRRKQNNEKQDQDTVSLEDNQGIKSANTSSCPYIEVSSEQQDSNIKRKKPKKLICNDDKLDKMPVDIKKDKSIEDTSRNAKKKKSKVQEQEIVKIKPQQESIEDNQKIRKKRNQIVIENVLGNEKNSPEETQSEYVKINKISKKKQKVDKSLNDDDSQQTISIAVNNKVKKKNINNKEEKKNSIQKELVQDEEVNNDRESKKSKKKKKRKIVEEEPINDEDIDKYCDALEPSYNKQYEDWVKLIEANLSSNKKNKQ